jgi:hypothetical protein
MGEVGFVVKLSVENRRVLGEELAEAIRHRAGRTPLTLTISEEPAITDGSVIIQDVEGRQWWNVGLVARLDRLWPELRRQIAARASLVTSTKPAGGAA